jgi:hypothetical protein
LGWFREAASLLVRLCTHDGGLPQGAPTSPRLSNLVNYRLDDALANLASSSGDSFSNPFTRKLLIKPLSQATVITYTRYADDLTFSFSTDEPLWIHYVIRSAKKIVRREGYELHVKKKLRIHRRHDRQLVTGLVVNQRVNLPREVRRRLRAIEHHLRTGRSATLSPEQLAGWRGFLEMVRRQASRDQT